DDLLFLAGEFRLQLLRDRSSHLTFDRKDVGKLAIKGIRPKMRIIGRFDELNVYPHGVAALLYAAFEDVGDTQLLCNLWQIFRSAPVMLCGRTRDHLQIGDLR